MANNEKYIIGDQGYFGYGVQAALGTPVVATKFQQIFFEDGFQEVPEPREAVPTANRGVGYISHSAGRIQDQGPESGPLVGDEFFTGMGIAAFMGNDNTVSGDANAGFTHVFNQPDFTNANKLFPQAGGTIEILLGGSDNTALKDHEGAFISAYTMNIPATGLVTWSTDLVGVKNVQDSVVASPSFSTVAPFEGWMRKLWIDPVGSIGSTLIEVNGDMGFTRDNKVEMEPGANATQYPVGRSTGTPDVTFNFTTNLQDQTLWDMFKDNTNKAVRISLTHTAVAGAVSGVYSYQIDLPNVFFSAGEPVLNSPRTVAQPVAVQALHDSGTGYTMQITTVNSESGTYSV